MPTTTPRRRTFLMADGVGLTIFLGERDGRPVITDVIVQAEEVTPETLRRIPLARYEAQIEDLRWADKIEGQLLAGRPADPLVAPLADLRAMFAQGHELAKKRRGRRRPPLTRPDGKDPDRFYKQVGQAYREYAQETRAAAARIADEAGVPVTTAHRWVREARRRGHLSPGRKGRTL